MHVHLKKINKMNFAIISNSQHIDLYEESKYFYSNLDYPLIRVPGNNGYYGFKFINDLILSAEKYPYDWVALIDEDCFITDVDAMMDLVIYQMNNKIPMSGMPDGGLIPLREFNPVGINTFFTVLDLKSIREKYVESEVKMTKYKREYDKFIPHDILKLPYFSDKITYLNKSCDPFNFEPYYKIYFWLLENEFNMKYLYSELWNADIDHLTNILYNHENKPFAYHTWRSRFWKSDLNNRERILRVINHCKKLEIYK